MNHMPHTARVSSRKRNGNLYTKILKQCLILLGCIAFTLGSTFVLEVFVIAPILKSDRPLILQFYKDNHPINNLTLRSKGTVDVSIVPSGNLAYATSLRILISNQTVANAIWVVPGQDLKVSAFVSGQSEIFILGPSYGISWLTLATLPVLVTG